MKIFIPSEIKIRYIEHEYYSDKEELDKFHKRVGGPSCAYWPHYSLRPSVLRVSAILDVGDFVNETGHFEMDYAKRYVEKGYKSAFLDTISCYHIGKCTWEKGYNSYSLNGVKQFNDIPTSSSSSTENKKNIQIVDEGEWYSVEKYDSYGHDLKWIDCPDIDFLKAVASADPNCKGFNSLGYLKSYIQPQDSWTDVSNQFPNFKMYVKR